MAMINCPTCGNLVPDNSTNCPHCGSYIYVNTYMQVKPVTPGRGFGITSMIMGILALIYAIIPFSAAMSIASSRSKYDIVRYGYSYVSRNVTEIIFAASMPSIIFSILALVFGGVAMSKGYKRGQSKSGVVMGIIALALFFIALIVSST